MAGAMAVTVKSAAVEAALAKLLAQIPVGIARALEREGDRILFRSQNEFVPTDLNDLKSSGKRHDAVWEGETCLVTLSYGDEAVDYAEAVHEHPSVHSPRSWKRKGTMSSNYSKAASKGGQRVTTEGMVTFHPEGHGPKYLEKPYMEAKPTMQDRIGAEMRPYLGL